VKAWCCLAPCGGGPKLALGGRSVSAWCSLCLVAAQVQKVIALDGRSSSMLADLVKSRLRNTKKLHAVIPNMLEK